MEILWPDTLPLPTVQGHNIQPGDTILRTEMDAGLAWHGWWGQSYEGCVLQAGALVCFMTMDVLMLVATITAMAKQARKPAIYTM